MTDYSEFYKDYSLAKTEKSMLIKWSYPLNSYGRAFIYVTIRPPNLVCKQMIKNGEETPTLKLIGLIDTGATLSCIRKGAYKGLKLKSTPGVVISGLHNEPRKCRNINLSINIDNVFPDTGFLDICPVIPNWSDDAGFDFIIGWDILRYCQFDYNNPKGKFKLKFIGE